MTKIKIKISNKLTSSWSRMMRAIGRKASANAIAALQEHGIAPTHMKDGKVVLGDSSKTYKKPKRLKFKPVFKSQKEYQEFAGKFSTSLIASLKRQAAAQAASIERAKHHPLFSENKKKG